MAKNQELYDKIRKILIKKAEGYFYSEETFEYVQKPQNKEEQLCMDDIINEKETTKQNQPLTLVKKKVTSHYIPPDMLAIKILLENFGEKIGANALDLMSEQELLEYKDKLISDIEKLTKEDKK